VISLSNISKQYGGKVLFKDLSVRIGDRERVAIVGANGAGKSTLMKIIMGEIEADSGEIARSRSHTEGYLPQEGVHHGGRTLYEETATAFEDIIALHDRIDDITSEMKNLAALGESDTEYYHDLLHELGEMQHHLEHREGYNIQSKIAEVLGGLGFRERDMRRGTEEFSGGWQMRIALAKLLLQEPAILLLDEPTNHLDLDSLEWLESYLQAYEGSVVLISHDRRFLDNIVTRTLEVSLGRLTDYSGNYSFYLVEKVQRMEQQQAAYENQQQYIKQTMQFVERFRYKATKARQVQSRLKMLEKIERVEIEDQEKGISFDFPIPPAPGRMLMELHHVRKAYGSHEIFDDLSLPIERGDRIAFLGVNGSGKSTLARIIAGIEPYQSGTRNQGHNVVIGYYAQHQAEELEPKKTVLQTVDDIATGDARGRLRTLLGCFLFSGDDVFKNVSVLSGGEKSRLALAKMLLTPSNLLVLDEPTNHLDIRSKAVLQDALSRYEGSFVIVSHDRDFLEPLINKCIDFDGGHPRITTGTVSDYLRKRHEEMLRLAPQHDSGGEDIVTRSAQHLDKERKRREAEQRQERYKVLKPLKAQLARIEKRIADLEAEKEHAEAGLASEETYKNDDTARSLTAAYKDVTTRLAYAYDEWTRVMEQIEDCGSDV
jgi:ATP-binding cassette, subfamily F, member 3